MKYSRTAIVVGTAVSLIGLIGFSAAAWYCITHDIEEPQPHARFAAIWFSLMMALMGFSAVLRFASLRVPRLCTVASLAWCGSIGMFGMAFLLIGVFEDSLSGGIPLMPRAVNEVLGRTLFIAVGLVVLAAMPKLFRYQQEEGRKFLA